MKKLLKFLLVVCLLAFIQVKASEVPNVTITDIRVDGNVINKNEKGIYVTDKSSIDINYTVDNNSDDYCFTIFQRSYNDYPLVGKVSYGFGVSYDPICENYVGNNSYNFNFWNEPNIELRIGFIKKSDYENAVKNNHYNYADLELFNYKSLILNGKVHESTDKVKLESIVDSNKNIIKENQDYVYLFSPNTTYYAKFKIISDALSTYKYSYYLNYSDTIDGIVNNDNGYLYVPFKFTSTDATSGDMNIYVLNESDINVGSDYLTYELTTKKVAKLDVTYKSTGEKAPYDFAYSFNAKDYNTNKPIILNIDLKNFTNSEYNSNINFLKISWDDEKNERIETKEYTKNVKLYTNKSNQVEISFVPNISKIMNAYIIEIEVDGVKSQYDYFYTEGIINSAFYDYLGNLIMKGGGYGNVYSGNYYQKSPAFKNNIYVMYGGSNFEDTKNYNYEINLIKDEEKTKTLISKGTLLGKEINNKNVLANIKIPDGVKKQLEINLKLFDSNGKEVCDYSDYVNFEDKTNLHTFMTDNDNIDIGAYGFYEYISTGLDSYNIKLIGLNYDENKNYGYLVTNENKYIISGTITGKELNAGKIIKIDKLVKDYTYCDVSIYELGEDIIRNYDSQHGSYFNISIVSKDSYSKIKSRKHFLNDPTKILELLKNINNNTAKLIDISASSTPVPSNTTTPTNNANLDEFKITSVGSKNVKLSWNKVSEAKGYIVYTSTNGKKWKKLTTTKKNSVLTYNNTKLKPGTKHYYKVVAYKVVKKKNKTIVTSKVLNAVTIPSTPKTSIKSNTYNSIRLTIKKVSGATRYDIYRSTSKNGSYEKIGETKSTTYNDVNLTTGKTYYYKVRACNTGCSGNSKIISRKVTLSKPSLKVKSTSKGKVVITPSVVAGEDGYVIEVSTKKNKGFKEVANLDKETKTYLIEGLKSKKTYYYRVKAYRVVDEKPVYGTYSKVIKVKVK